LHGRAVDLNMRPVERVGLPHLVGVGLGEGQPDFVGRLGVGLEQFKFPDQPVKSGAGDLRALKLPLFNAEAVKDGAFGNAAMRFGEHGLNGFKDVFRFDLAGLALVGAGLLFHDRDTVFAVAAQPGGDGAPGEPAGLSVLVGEGHLADGLNTRPFGFALGHVHGAEHAHLQVSGGISHECYFSGCPPRSFFAGNGVVLFTATTLKAGGRGQGLYYRVVARLKERRRKTWRR